MRICKMMKTLVAKFLSLDQFCHFFIRKYDQNCIHIGIYTKRLDETNSIVYEKNNLKELVANKLLGRCSIIYQKIENYF